MSTIQHWLAPLLVPLVMVAGCSNGGNGGGTPTTDTTLAPPAGLVERDESPIYAVGITIVPETISNSGGAIAQCTVSPPLAPGLTLDPQTCTITGTPTDPSHATVYTITASNAAGSATTRVEIEVKDAPIPPDGLDYLHRSVVYVANTPITPNISAGREPAALGGAVRHIPPPCWLTAVSSWQGDSAPAGAMRSTRPNCMTRPPVAGRRQAT